MLVPSNESEACAAPHARAPGDVLGALGVEVAAGLASGQAASRLVRYGSNTLRARERVGAWRILINQFESSVVVLLATAAVVAFLFGEWREGLAIVVVLAINTVIGYVTEIRAVRSMEALRRLGSRSARVRRDGDVLALGAEQLVPGDIVLLEGGDVITADLRLVESAALHCDESTLTGESTDVAKSPAAVAADTIVAERSCMAFKGTAVTRGTGTGVVTATGMRTELGRISKLVEEAEPESSPLERRLARLSRQLIWLTLTLAALVAGIGIARGQELLLMVEAAIALAVAAIPEGLPIVATMALARGMLRMARSNALVERLAAVETLGATTVIFTDKTGTLTENRMSVARLVLPCGSIVPGEARAPLDETPLLRRALEVGLLCNDASPGGDGAAPSGDPMEVALLEAGALAGLDRDSLLDVWPRLAERPFDSESMMMATLHARNGRTFAAVKGAPEAVLASARRLAGADGDEPLDAATRSQWLERVEALAGEGLRVLGLAAAWVPDADGFAYRDMSFLGLVAFSDPPRDDVPDAIRACRNAGVRVVMVTGDHAVTAGNIARAIGLTDRPARVIEGRHLKPGGELTERDREAVLAADVFARVSPAQKLDLIAVSQAKGEIVAMTGDGVNDAPALKKADIGVAMGRRGTEVAREAADVVLRDDAFPTIVVAIREGRIIFDNIRRFVVYLLSCNLAEVLIVSIAVLAGLPLPLLPLQILFLNLVTDVFPPFALAAGEGRENILGRPPRDPRESILERRHWHAIAGHGASICAATLAAFVLALFWLEVGERAAVTVSFLTLAFAQLWHVFNMRARDTGLLLNGVTRNPFVWGALALCTAILIAAVYTEPLAGVLHVVKPDGGSWAVIISMSLLPVVAGQLALARNSHPGAG